MEESEIDDLMLEVLSFFEEMTFEKIVLDWPIHADSVTREELEASLVRLKGIAKVEELKSSQGPAFKKKFAKKKKWWSLS